MRIQSCRIMVLVLIGMLFPALASVYAGAAEESSSRAVNAYVIKQGATITISGVAKRYDKVALFKNGSANIPIKTESVSSGTGRYKITINIPGDMIQSRGRYLVDMRFWKDVNKNNIKEDNEPHSACNFITWHPETGKAYLKVYGGSSYEITSSDFIYNPR